MTLVARLAMLITLVYFTFGWALLWIFAFLGEAEMLADTFDLPLDMAVPPAMAICFGMAMMWPALISLGLGFWELDRILMLRDPQDFARMGAHLRRCAYAFFGFWVLNAMNVALQPVVLSAHLPPELRPEVTYIDIDIDVVFLALAAVFMAISRSLKQAQDIADENSQFL
ncbi:hypothetical protein J7382_12210 [Shimia sp. R11_0]|uniref:hypothetical protein n=1 Tax=Shimia sp. R11_0 TaxID=2821096 RepID=UPI001ADA35BD|nr:hypothetical protein [Shimia sp. R11_0]MBO9478300.1 hypothetical protein [Shimia sp. R11_0]